MNWFRVVRGGFLRFEFLKTLKKLNFARCHESPCFCLILITDALNPTCFARRVCCRFDVAVAAALVVGAVVFVVVVVACIFSRRFELSVLSAMSVVPVLFVLPVLRVLSVWS